MREGLGPAGLDESARKRGFIRTFDEASMPWYAASLESGEGARSRPECMRSCAARPVAAGAHSDIRLSNRVPFGHPCCHRVSTSTAEATHESGRVKVRGGRQLS